MKKLLLLILPILVIVTASLVVFGFFQVRFEEEKLIDELMRKAKAVAESTGISVKYVLLHNDARGAARLVDRFQKRERLQGCVIYNKDGDMVASTERFSDWQSKDKPYLKEVFENSIPKGGIQKFKNYTVYSYALPILNDEEQLIGAVELIYDTSYMLAQLMELWKRLSITLIFLLAIIVLISFWLQRHIFITPVERLTEWFRRFQRGEIDEEHPIKQKGELGRLASEVEQVALGLRVARRVVTEEAQLRVEREERWTESKLKDLVKARLGDSALIVVSNREPYLHFTDEVTGNIRCSRPASGVVTAIDPIMKACGGTWIAHGGANADKRVVNSKDKLGVPPDDNRYILKRVWLSKEEEDGYYYGFANEGLWPLCHITHTRPVFRQPDWQWYKKVNQKFANSVLEELPSKNPFVFIQDYHFTLLPRMIKEKRPDATIALFWHIPWPNPEVFSICPYQGEVLDGMLGCDLIGFHVQYHCNNFLDTANRLLESRVDAEKFSVIRSGKETIIRAFPISIDASINAAITGDDREAILRIKKEHGLSDKIVALGVDRIDYTKGIAERIQAIDRFLGKNPEYKNKFVFIQLAAPSRTHIKRYHDLIGEIDEMVEKVNWKHSDGEWEPIIYLKRHFPPEEIKLYYHMADICVVSSLHDGMNLVAKEYVASKTEDDGVLILSKFTGAARELSDAIQVNPYSIEEFSEAIRYAAAMTREERERRMKKMRERVAENNVYRWAGNIITEITSLKK